MVVLNLIILSTLQMTFDIVQIVSKEWLVLWFWCFITFIGLAFVPYYEYILFLHGARDGIAPKNDKVVFPGCCILDPYTRQTGNKFVIWTFELMQHCVNNITPCSSTWYHHWHTENIHGLCRLLDLHHIIWMWISEMLLVHNLTEFKSQAYSNTAG